ncbi:MAG: hypothetical protein WC477_01760 [Patescibacteria group bacterium]
MPVVVRSPDSEPPDSDAPISNPIPTRRIFSHDSRFRLDAEPPKSISMLAPNAKPRWRYDNGLDLYEIAIPDRGAFAVIVFRGYEFGPVRIIHEMIPGQFDVYIRTDPLLRIPAPALAFADIVSVEGRGEWFHIDLRAYRRLMEGDGTTK